MTATRLVEVAAEQRVPHTRAGLSRAQHPPRSRSAAFGAVAVMLILGVVAASVWRGVWATGSDGKRQEIVAVRSAGADFESLNDLVDASTLVIIGRAVSVSPGRVFGSAATDTTNEASWTGGIVSEVVVVQVGAVLAGNGDPGPTIPIEEEAMTVDGDPIAVDGLRPTAQGDQGIFFLGRGPDTSEPYYATVSTSGRFIRGLGGRRRRRAARR